MGLFYERNVLLFALSNLKKNQSQQEPQLQEQTQQQKQHQKLQQQQQIHTLAYE